MPTLYFPHGPGSPSIQLASSRTVQRRRPAASRMSEEAIRRLLNEPLPPG
jgi:hypothetical protein